MFLPIIFKNKLNFIWFVLKLFVPLHRETIKTNNIMKTISIEEMIKKIIKCANINPIFGNMTIDNADIKIDIECGCLMHIWLHCYHNNTYHRVSYSNDGYHPDVYSLKHWVYDSIKGWQFVGVMKSNFTNHYKTMFN